MMMKSGINKAAIGKATIISLEKEAWAQLPIQQANCGRN
jgi:hypothetical protein